MAGRESAQGTIISKLVKKVIRLQSELAACQSELATKKVELIDRIAIADAIDKELSEANSLIKSMRGEKEEIRKSADATINALNAEITALREAAKSGKRSS